MTYLKNAALILLILLLGVSIVGGLFGVSYFYRANQKLNKQLSSLKPSVNVADDLCAFAQDALSGSLNADIVTSDPENWRGKVSELFSKHKGTVTSDYSNRYPNYDYQYNGSNYPPIPARPPGVLELIQSITVVGDVPIGAFDEFARDMRRLGEEAGRLENFSSYKDTPSAMEQNCRYSLSRLKGYQRQEQLLLAQLAKDDASGKEITELARTLSELSQNADFELNAVKDLQKRANSGSISVYLRGEKGK
ncbi:MAG: hypothetical protein HY397_01495 [Candidatus Doudnabacteria bacterium]|nr:hypothetical protein [Candidatus Doudnabacteria bacterium]